MDISAFVDINSLSEEAKAELKSFYDYLKFKYSTKSDKTELEHEQKKDFFRFLSKHSYSLSKDYKFNREELHER